MNKVRLPPTPHRWVIAVAESPWSNRLLAYVAGQTYEACSVLWVRNAATGHAWHVALFSALQATMLVLGVGESVRGRWCAPFFVAGYSVGAFAAMRWTS